MSTKQILSLSPRIVALAAAATVAAAAAPASAQTATSTMAVGATVTNNCIVSTTPIALGNIDVTSTAARDTTGGIAVTCTNGAAWSAAADAGQAAGATPATRQMASGADLLNYALYSDAPRTVLWGDGTAGTVAITDVGTGAVQNKVIYASVLPGQATVHAGTYADQINVTVTY
ncbi:Csu type fimbrial protein [Sphingomonas sp. PAMC 26605]|uniref:Csu type fimbrial protein n=1 Tax=Sphingomonas sp. PAMC 26605 TaxID=1112214 RepID=UPI00026CCA68|nr:spore coat protein U domain-containing protein [Sphingomonas sp. PAMC 26605]